MNNAWISADMPHCYYYYISMCGLSFCWLALLLFLFSIQAFKAGSRTHVTCTASRFLGVACLYRSWRGGTMRSRRHLWRKAATAPAQAARISNTMANSAGCIRKLTNWTGSTPAVYTTFVAFVAQRSCAIQIIIIIILIIITLNLYRNINVK